MDLLQLYKMLNENFEGHENRAKSWKIYEGPHVQKKRYSFLILLCNYPVPEGFPKGIFLLAEKCQKLTLLNKVVSLRQNYFFPKGVNIGLFNPTNAQTAVFPFASVPSILR